MGTNNVGERPSEEGERTVDGAIFAAFAGEDLDRWRELIGRSVEHRHSAWGRGVVEDVFWRAYVEQGAASVQIRVRYKKGLRAAIAASAFGEMHPWVSVATELADLLTLADGDAAAPDDEREARLAEYTLAARERRDRAHLQRIPSTRKRGQATFSA